MAIKAVDLRKIYTVGGNEVRARINRDFPEYSYIIERIDAANAE